MPSTLPGAPPRPAALEARLRAALAAKGPDYAPRTAHLVDGRARYTNRLILESSPYLLQHAHNPVDWHPWGDEAFAEARRRGVPVFLSVGYSTCHWCHVMERESFEDEEVARYLNEHFVAIKVDREERPDIDAVYMSATQAMTGGGGWPMSLVLDHERRPFFAGTYLPPRDGARARARGLLTVMRELHAAWRRDPQELHQRAAALTAAVRRDLGAAEPAAGLPGADALRTAMARYAQRFDPAYGGLRGAPKFPSSLPVRALLRWHRRTGDAEALRMAVVTLERMAAGGLYDQLGGGFHRYSTDARWLVPHFEKMLYDNALLALAYLEAHQVTGRADLARVARETLEYVLRDMRAPGGGFYSATDADAGGVEGAYFVWTEREVRGALGADAERFVRYYGVTPGGNFHEVAHGNVLHVPAPDEAEHAALTDARARLLALRARRAAPLRDEKVLTAWNGLMISALAVGGRVLAEPRFVDAARRAAAFAWEHLRREGTLHRSLRDGRLGPAGYLDDHAFLSQGLLDLYEATFEPIWLERAAVLADEAERRFADRERGGWFMTGEGHEALLAREKPAYDGAEPSGNSVLLRTVLRLEGFTGEARWRERAERALRAFAARLSRAPTALGEMLLALDWWLDEPRQVVLVWPQGERPAGPLLDAVRATFAPNAVLLAAAEGEPLGALQRVAPFVAHKRARGGRPTAYVCERFRCEAPTIEPAVLAEHLRAVRPLP